MAVQDLALVSEPVEPCRTVGYPPGGATACHRLHQRPAGGGHGPPRRSASASPELGARRRRAAARGPVVESLPVSEAESAPKTGRLAAHLGRVDRLARALCRRRLSGRICYRLQAGSSTEGPGPILPHHGALAGTAMAFDTSTPFAAFEHPYPRASRRPRGTTAARTGRASATAIARPDWMTPPARPDAQCTLRPARIEPRRFVRSDALHEGLANYRRHLPRRLMQHHIDFLSEVIPTRRAPRERFCCHTDDPPFPLLRSAPASCPPLPISPATAGRPWQLPPPAMTLCTGREDGFASARGPKRPEPPSAPGIRAAFHFSITGQTSPGHGNRCPAPSRGRAPFPVRPTWFAVIGGPAGRRPRRSPEGRRCRDSRSAPTGQAIPDGPRARPSARLPPRRAASKGLAELRGLLAASPAPAAARVAAGATPGPVPTGPRSDRCAGAKSSWARASSRTRLRGPPRSLGRVQRPQGPACPGRGGQGRRTEMRLFMTDPGQSVTGGCPRGLLQAMAQTELRMTLSTHAATRAR